MPDGPHTVNSVNNIDNMKNIVKGKINCCFIEFQINYGASGDIIFIILFSDVLF